MDAETGVSYEKGYYDETGRRYDNVAFAENGSYRNVVCHCPYCGQDTILDLSVGEEGQRYLSCAHCGGPMELRSELDTIQRPPNGNTHVYRSEESLKNAFPKRKKKRVWPIVAVVLLALGLLGKLAESGELRPFGGEIQQISVVETKAETIYLEKQPSGAYHLVTDPIRADKLLSYDRDADSYYDETTACWLWRNTDVTPPVWQYWVEGISSDYGDWGWMEHEADGWYIEASEGEWIAVPARYDTSGLWWIE